MVIATNRWATLWGLDWLFKTQAAEFTHRGRAAVRELRGLRRFVEGDAALPGVEVERRTPVRWSSGGHPEMTFGLWIFAEDEVPPLGLTQPKPESSSLLPSQGTHTQGVG